MQSMRSKQLSMGWLWPLALVLLTSCGGGGGYGGMAGASGVGNSTGSVRIFTATLTGAQEVPPNASTATGTGTVVVDTATKALTATVTTAGIVGTVAHIHSGVSGVSGPVVFPLAETALGSGRWGTTVTLTPEEFNLLMAGSYYINVHSLAFPAGEIRGQIIFQQSSGGAGGY